MLRKALTNNKNHIFPKFLLLLIFSLGISFYSFGKKNAFYDSVNNVIEKELDPEKQTKLALQILQTDPNANQEVKLMLALKWLESAKEQQNEKNLARFYLAIGKLFGNRGNVGESLIYKKKAVLWAEKSKDSVFIHYYYNIIATDYAKTGNFKEAKILFTKSYNYLKKIEDYSGLSSVTENLSGFYLMQKQYVQACEEINKSIKLDEQLGDTSTLLRLYLNAAIVYSAASKYDSASYFYDKELKLLQYAPNKLTELSVYLNKGEMFLQKGDYSQAILTLNIAEKISKEENNLRALKEIYRLKAASYTAKMDFKNSSKYYKLAYQFSDSIYNYEVSEDMAEIQNSINSKLELNEIESLKNEQKNNSTTISTQNFANKLILVFLILSILFGVYTYIQSKNKSAVLQRLRLQNNENIKQQKVIIEQRNSIKARNEKLVEIHHNTQKMFRMLAHDLRGPLAGILGLIEIIEMDNLNLDDETKMIFSQINKSAERLTERLTKMLEDARSESGNYGFNLKEENLIPITLEVLEQFRGIAISKKIELEFIALDDEISAFIDKNAYFQIAENLISNAIKFSNPETKVEIRLFTTDDKATLEVKDSGPGFTAEDRTRLFTFHQKLSAIPTGNETSSGVGLALVKFLVDAMEGNIQLESEMGKGSTFRCSFNKKEKLSV